MIFIKQQFNPPAVAKILMLDLEGVLIATAIPPHKHRVNADYRADARNNYGVRPHAHAFLQEVLPHFDQTYLNTTVQAERALGIMRLVFNNTTIKYYNWDHASKQRKTSGYEQFANDTLVHIEDEPENNPEAVRIRTLGHTFISIPTWTTHAAYETDPHDEALLRTIKEIKAIL